MFKNPAENTEYNWPIQQGAIGGCEVERTQGGDRFPFHQSQMIQNKTKQKINVFFFNAR